MAWSRIINQEPREPSMYSFNTDIRLQDEGGSIGNTLTCALAVLFMVYWSRGFKSKLSLATEDFPQFYLKMFRYYMDDGNLGSTALPPGSRLIDGKIRIVESEVEPDKNIPSDIRTSALVRDVGNSVCPFIQLTVDCPSLNQDRDGWMPILDIQVKMVDNRIQHKFYKKDGSGG